MNVRAAIFGSFSVLLVGVVSLQGADPSKQQADAFAKKMAIIAQHGETLAQAPAATAVPPRRTTVTESELNSWFAFRSQPLLPDGVSDPRMTLVGNGKVMGTATVDIEAIVKRRGGGTFNPLSLLGGRVPVNVTGVLQTKDGQGRFDLEAADVSGLPVPKSLLQELVLYYTRSDERPQGIRMDDPFELPSEIKQIDVGPGQAVLVQ